MLEIRLSLNFYIVGIAHPRMIENDTRYEPLTRAAIYSPKMKETLSFLLHCHCLADAHGGSLSPVTYVQLV
ncbi:hypothetical protein Nos7524_0219 [Nostoc sp. PCC 7524]|nr:hypothetical protein Nos7524_0219 [Nostoc sp. PCC 7524]